jgi:hypothetical protein
MDKTEAQLESFLVRYLPGVAALGRAAIKHLRARLPGCDALAYDNYQALAVGFSPDGKTGSAFVSVALYPRWVNLFFLQGSTLKDREGLLQGSGSTVRHIRLERVEDLDLPAVRTLIEAAREQAPARYEPERAGQLVIRSISARQKPRRPQ